jgi:glycosyltransferase involved in cell wall biosynthesis
MLIRNSAAVICVCKAVKNYYFRLGTNRVHVIYNGIATKDQFDEINNRKHMISKHSDYIFAIVGSIAIEKGQETAIRAIYNLYKRGFPVRLVIAGSGKEAYVDQCKKLVDILKISNIVEFTGFVGDPYEIYFTSDCLLMCSDYEGLSRVTIEAMSACLPVIGRNSGGTPEIIEHKKTGMLYDTFDELVKAMIMMVKNPDWGRQLGLVGWQSAKERFNIENYAANVYKVIQSVSKVTPG